VATRLIRHTQNRDLAMGVVRVTKRLSAHVNALDPISALVDLSLAACNDIEVYKIVMTPLDYDVGALLAKSPSIIKRCLKDKDVKKDFVDEKDSSNQQRAASACKILVEEKLVKSCKGGK